MKFDSVKRKAKIVLSGVCLLSGLIFVPPTTGTAATNEIILPKPQIQTGMSVMQALEKRQTSRNFADTDLSLAQLSHILWAANGINRPNSDGYTNPAALGVHSVEVYTVTAKGIFLYRPKSHTLEPIADGDFRMTTTTGQAFVGKAPLTLVYVGNSSAWQNARHVPSAEQQTLYDSIAAGAMTQSVSLVSASEGLGTCVRGSINKEAFGKAARLRDGQRILLAQTVGVLP